MILDGAPEPNSVKYTSWRIRMQGESSGLIYKSEQSDGPVGREAEGGGEVPRVSCEMILHY